MQFCSTASSNCVGVVPKPICPASSGTGSARSFAIFPLQGKLGEVYFNEIPLQMVDM